VQPLFGFDENALFVIDRDRKQYRMWYDNLAQPYEEGKRSQQGAGIPIEGNQVAEDVFQDRPVYLRDREEMLAFSTGNASLTEWIVASGTEEVMIGPLKVGGQIIGCFNSHSRRKGTFTTPMLPLYQNVCDQIAVAVANILANEEILEREREKSILLSISESLATIRDKQQLLKVVFEKVRPLFGFYDTGLFVLDSDRQYIEDWTVTLPEADPSEANIRLRSQDAGRIGFKDSAMEWAINQLKGVEGPEIFPYNEETFARFPEYPQFAVIKQIGYKESLAALLRTNQGELGILFFNSLTEGHFQVAQFTLFQAIADQVAVAVANILANEEILEREREKSQLLEITELIAQVKATNDLLRLIVDKIKPLFGFHDCGLFVVSPDGKTHSDLAAVLPDVSPSAWNEAIAAVSADVAHGGSLVEWAMNELEATGGPVLFDFKELVERFPDYPQFNGIGPLEMGYRDCLAASLTVRGKSIGFFCINALKKDFFAPAIFPLFQSVTHSIAIAVANILANEEILEREREKALLLSLSEDMATIREGDDLWRVMMEKAKLLLPFDESPQVCVLDSEGKQMRFLLIDPSKEAVQTKEYQENVPTWFPVVNTPFAKALNAVTPTVFTYSFFQQHYPDYWGTRIWQQVGIQEMLAVQLSYAGKVIGIFNILSRETGAFSPRFFSLFKAIADQVAVAVANILANEEILEREREKSLQIAITQAMAEAGSWEEKFMKVGRELDQAVPFHHIYFSINAPAGHRGYGFVQRQKGAYAFMSHADFVQAAGLSRRNF
jgi:GAF domain-containing protein